jgi:hypothetical protein
MIYDVVVVGGGPAGIMAAGRAAERGLSVLLVEKNPSLGKKLLITGKGRCNITSSQTDGRDFISVYGKNGPFLFSAFHKFSPADTIRFFEERGLSLKEERGMRIFPESDHSSDVLKVLETYLKDNGVEFRFNVAVKKINFSENKIDSLLLKDGSAILGNHYILACGGLSYPATGSTGDAVPWLRELGHKIVPVKAALVPIICAEKWIRDLAGISLKNVNISVWANNKKADERFGEALFTHEGMSGPIILDMAKKIGQLLESSQVKISIDFKPALSFQELDDRLLRDIASRGQQTLPKLFPALLPGKLAEKFLELLGYDERRKVMTISKEERKEILHLLKEFPLMVKKLAPIDEAIITSGGVDLLEIDPRTMKSKLYDNLSIVGELLDLDGPTGGYNLQVAWSTGYVAGEGV